MRQETCQPNSGGGRALSLKLYQPRQWARAVPGTEPARNGHREAASSAAGHDDVDFFDRWKFTDQCVGRRRRLSESKVSPFAVTFVRQQRPVRRANRVIEVTCQIVPAPAVVGEGARVLGTDDEHGVRVEREVLAVPESRHRPAERAREALRRAARVIGDAVRRLAGEQRYRARARREAPRDVIGRPRARLFVLADAVRVAAGMAEGGHRDLARTRAAPRARGPSRPASPPRARASAAPRAAHRSRPCRTTLRIRPLYWGPRHGPQTPFARRAPAEPWRASIANPFARRAPAEPWRAS